MKKNLQEENKELRKKLSIAQSWMKREIESQILTISKNKILEKSQKKKSSLISEEMEEIITEKILNFFHDIPLINFPEDIISNIIESEIEYYLFIHKHHFSPLSITIWYQKSIEILIENFITSGFRSFVKKENSIPKSFQKDSLENSLSLVIEKWYSLSIWRLYHLLFTIKKKEIKFHYEKLFQKYLKKYNFLKNTLLKKEFLLQLKLVVESEVFSTKRHTWKISKDDILQIRTLCIGNFSNKNCLIYSLFKTQEII